MLVQREGNSFFRSVQFASKPFDSGIVRRFAIMYKNKVAVPFEAVVFVILMRPAIAVSTGQVVKVTSMILLVGLPGFGPGSREPKSPSLDHASRQPPYAYQ